ncbi:hypothetical protein K458DRAFT_416394 [Lentithecium fluviatile CBS 122367]|uniref:Uncharacterized protein n=1 Tax=Lentithecium fluviatile CBS 122367 TaxID=1168545 RepID=A0A6G1J668_9PLEO|nr:hypothetical protein K458DRAFT_416394 [Lentithecium fluviatile CBS 122367]
MDEGYLIREAAHQALPAPHTGASLAYANREVNITGSGYVGPRTMGTGDENGQPCAESGHRWSRKDGEACEGCGAAYLRFVMQCRTRGCGVRMCWRCINNRS